MKKTRQEEINEILAMGGLESDLDFAKKLTVAIKSYQKSVKKDVIKTKDDKQN